MELWRPTVGVDVDDVLADFTLDALRRLNKLRGTAFVLNDVSTWDPFDSLPPEHQQDRDLIYSDMKQEGACFSLPVVPGSKEGMKALREIADVVIITHPFKHAKTWVHERELWLDHHFDIHRDDIFSCKKKFLVDVDVFLDDKPENVVQWRAHRRSIQGLIWATPMNRNERGHVSRVNSWSSVVRYVDAVRRLRRDDKNEDR